MIGFVPLGSFEDIRFKKLLMQWIFHYVRIKNMKARTVN